MDVYDLLLTGSRLLHGDSGSWVVDLHTGKVIGHVIASDCLAEAYVLPMVEILQQIRDLSDARCVKIANSSDIMAFNHSRNNSSYGDGPDEVDLSTALDGFLGHRFNQPWDPLGQLHLQSVESRRRVDGMFGYLSDENQSHTPLDPIRQHQPESVESQSSASMGSNATVSTVPTTYSFEEDTEADASITVKST
ncbi:hypothetical protein LZ32DRAFT_127122 [Colletotrichum eremochloae]|nr:hypothetical protein LZ32DRAFT_127122 [Colletotrichum eremochloae]